MRRADSGDDARGADRSGAHADFDRGGARGNQISRAFGGDHVAGNDGDAGPATGAFFQLREHRFGVAGGGVDGDDIGAGFDQRVPRLKGAGADADGGTDAQATFRIFAGLTVLHGLDDIRSGHQADESSVGIDEGKFFDAVFVEDRFGFRLRTTGRGGDQPLARRHHVFHENIVVLFHPDIPAGDDAEHDVLAIDHGETLDAGLAHTAAELSERGVRGDGLGVGDDDVFGAFDPPHHGDLFVQGAVAVDDADAAFSRQRHGEAFLRNGVHGGRNHRDGQPDVGRDARGNIGLRGQDATASRDDGHVVEAQTQGQCVIHGVSGEF